MSQKPEDEEASLLSYSLIQKLVISSYRRIKYEVLRANIAQKL